MEKNNEQAGTTGQNLRIEAIKIKLQNADDYTVEYRVYVQDFGWTDWRIDGEIAGTVGETKRLEAIQIRIVRKYKRNYKGIDVSQYQNSINWRLVKEAGIDFAFIRVGFRGYGQAGRFKEDNMYRANMMAVRNANIKTGVYFVTQATNDAEAVEEANWVLERVKNYKLEYPIALDIESPGKESPTDVGRAEYLDVKTRTRLANIFCRTIENAGYKAMIYTNLNWANNCLNMYDLNEYDTWIAQYNNKSSTDYTENYTIWQYTSQGRVNGIFGVVDMNIGYKNY